MEAHQSQPEGQKRPAPPGLIPSAKNASPIGLAEEVRQLAPTNSAVQALVERSARATAPGIEPKTALGVFRQDIAALKLVDDTIFDNLSQSPRNQTSLRLGIAQRAESELRYLHAHVPQLFFNNVSALAHDFLSKTLQRLSDRHVKPGDAHSEGVIDRTLDQLRILLIRASRVPLKQEDTRLGEKGLGGNPTIQGAAKGTRLADRAKPTAEQVEARIAEKKARIMQGSAKSKDAEGAQLPTAPLDITPTDAYEHVGSGTPDDPDYETYRLRANPKPAGVLQSLKALANRGAKPPLVENSSTQEQVYSVANTMKRWVAYELDFMAKTGLPIKAGSARISLETASADTQKLEGELATMNQQSQTLQKAMKPLAKLLLEAALNKKIELSMEEQRVATLLTAEPKKEVEAYELAPPHEPGLPR